MSCRVCWLIANVMTDESARAKSMALGQELYTDPQRAIVNVCAEHRLMLRGIAERMLDALRTAPDEEPGALLN